MCSLMTTVFHTILSFQHAVRFIDKNNYREIWENDWLKKEVSGMYRNNYVFFFFETGHPAGGRLIIIIMTYNYKDEVIGQAWNFN